MARDDKVLPVGLLLHLEAVSDGIDLELKLSMLKLLKSGANFTLNSLLNSLKLIELLGSEFLSTDIEVMSLDKLLILKDRNSGSEGIDMPSDSKVPTVNKGPFCDSILSKSPLNTVGSVINLVDSLDLLDYLTVEAEALLHNGFVSPELHLREVLNPFGDKLLEASELLEVLGYLCLMPMSSLGIELFTVHGKGKSNNGGFVSLDSFADFVWKRQGVKALGELFPLVQALDSGCLDETAWFFYLHGCSDCSL